VPAPRRAKAAAVGAAVLASALLAAPGTADAAPGEPVVAACSADSATLRYLVLFDPGTGEPAATGEVTAACGSMVVYYSQSAVAVATSGDSRFADRIGRDRAFSAERVVQSRGEVSPPRPWSDETGATAELVTANPTAVPGVDRAGEQWDMALMHADEARRINPGSRDVVVGVLDSGVDPNHPDLRGALDPALSAGCLTGRPDTARAAWEPTASPHGTHVAGTIAAADDGRGIAGVAPGVRIASVKVVDDDGFILPEYAVCGLMWAAAKGMTVTNNSYFVDPWLVTCNRGEEHVVYEALRRAVDYTTGHGVLTVAAATNGSVDLGRELDGNCRVLPAGLRGVVAVSAVGPEKLKSSYSAYGLGVVDVTAPGGEVGTPRRAERCVLSTVPGGYERSCGTSMATPHATGVVALLASEHPKDSPQQLTRLLTRQAEPIPCPADYDLNRTGVQDAYCSGYAPYNSFHGHGLVDALAAVSQP
jgi:subtilisin family serine protease